MTEEIECYRGVVHPWLCDAMGHLTTRHYSAMFDDGSYHLLSALGFDAETLHSGIGFADVNLNMSLKSELRVGDLIVIAGRVLRIGRSSIKIRYVMRNLQGGETAAELIATTVQFDLKARRSMEVLPVTRANARRLFPSADVT